MGYPTSRLITSAVRRSDEDNTSHERKWLKEKSAPQLFSRLVPKNEIVERPSAYRIPEPCPRIDGRHLGKQSALTVPDDHHLPQRCIGPIGIELVDNKPKRRSQHVGRISYRITRVVVKEPVLKPGAQPGVVLEGIQHVCPAAGAGGGPMYKDHWDTTPPVRLHKQKLCASLASFGCHYKAFQHVAH